MLHSPIRDKKFKLVETLHLIHTFHSCFIDKESQIGLFTGESEVTLAKCCQRNWCSPYCIEFAVILAEPPYLQVKYYYFMFEPFLPLIFIHF